MKHQLLSKKIHLIILLVLLFSTVLILFKQTNIRSNASSVSQLEPENGVLAGNVSVVTDSSASGGKAIQFENSPTIVYPAYSGMVNVKEHGVIGDGVTDDTQALLTIMHNTRNVSQTNMLYFPPGTYLVSSTLDWRNSAGDYFPYLSFYGAGKDKTIIKLKDNATGFTDKTTPKAVIYTATYCAPTQSGYPNNVQCTLGNSNEAYRNNIEDLTVNTGKGNPGAIGISWLANNRGYLLNLFVTSDDTQGFRGVDLTRNYGGPALVKNVTVDGFDTGIAVSAYSQSLTFEYIYLNNQKLYGLTNDRQPIFIRKLQSNNQVPAIHVNQLNNMGSSITLIDSTLTGTGTASTQYAIEILDGTAFLRNIATSGYAKAVKRRDNKTDALSYVDGPTVTEYTTHGPFTLFPTSTTSLNLAIKETPDIFYTTDMTQWANVVDYGAVPNAASTNFDSAPAFQKAIDSGKPIVYVPEGRYYLNDTVIIRGNVKAIYGFEAEITPTFTAANFHDANNPRPLFKFTGGTSDSVGLQNMRITNQYGRFDNPGLIGLIHATNKTLVLKDIYLAGILADYTTEPGVGEFFIENSQIGRVWMPNPQNVWARQLNPEAGPASSNSARLVNNAGGKAWILGIKTEGHGIIADTENGSYSEILGGAFYPAYNQAQLGEIVFINKNAHVFASFVAVVGYKLPGYDIMVQETQNGVTKTLDKTMVPVNGLGSSVPFYVGNP